MTPVYDVKLPLPIVKTLDYFKKHDFYTYRHIITVLALASILSRDLFSEGDKMVDIVIAAPFHDIGKISIPLNILRKKSPLTLDEFNVLQQHTATGYVLRGSAIGADFAVVEVRPFSIGGGVAKTQSQNIKGHPSNIGFKALGFLCASI